METLDRLNEIADRAEQLGIMAFDRPTLMMDVDTAYGAFDLNLDRLAEADDLDFTRDIVGIQKHIDRTDGTFYGCFAPKFASCTTRVKTCEGRRYTGYKEEGGKFPYAAYEWYDDCMGDARYFKTEEELRRFIKAQDTCDCYQCTRSYCRYRHMDCRLPEWMGGAELCQKLRPKR